MDLDISDILASVSRSHPPGPSTTSHHLASDTDTFTDHTLLTRAWTSERCAPSLLPYPTELMSRVMTRVQAQISRIEDLAAGMGEGSSAPDGLGSGRGPQSGTQNQNLILSILQTDLSRTQFLIRSLLRQRLAKITKFSMYYLSRSSGEADHDTKAKYLSPAEVAYLKHHQALLGEFYDASFLNAFPGGLRRLDDSSGGVNMVEGPDGDAAVVVRCLTEGWGNEREVEDGGAAEEGEGASVVLRMRRGEVWVVRWRDVRTGVEKGELELL